MLHAPRPSADAPHTDFARPPTQDPFSIDALDDHELDALPFGVVGLDAEGTILRYNAAEARLARLDRTAVVGRSFFEDVAPCTATDAFEGRFRELVAGQIPGNLVRFEYLFDFKFGAQDVTIEMLAAGGGRYYLLVNRTAFHPPREGLDPAWPAPLLRELVPESKDAGVVRDTREQRNVRAPLSFFASLLKTCDRVAPDTWPIFCHEWGVQWGRRTVVELETQSLEDGGESLRDRPMLEVARRLRAHLAEMGLGDLQLDLGNADSGVIRVNLSHSALVRAGGSTSTRRCHLVAGMLSAVFSHLAGRMLHVEEVRCEGRGDAACELLVVGASRREAVERLAAQGRTTDEVVRWLEELDDDPS